MKLSKSLFLAFAGLGLFACSNEDNVPSADNSHSGTFLTLTVVPERWLEKMVQGKER